MPRSAEPPWRMRPRFEVGAASVRVAVTHVQLARGSIRCSRPMRYWALCRDARDLPLASVIERPGCRIEQPIYLQGQSITVACSIGLAVFPAGGEDFDTLLRHADRAMYRQNGIARSGP
jgi:Diguanylate cyclase, GGDEF domain